jgi:NAD(P)-dependent dehydrogenase (short-subunit alcohol dehydrogenase family)
MHMQLKGKTALIAGAGRNNGRAIALRFAREGADLILISRKRREELDQVAKECERLGAKVLPILADVSTPDEVDRSVAQALERFGKVDVSVSVAAIRRHKDFWTISNEEWLEVFAVNLHSTFYLAKALAPSMMERRTGSIIALGGLASMTSQPQRAHVVASKTGLYGLIKSLALELGPYGIRANLIALSVIVNDRLNPEWYPEVKGNPRTIEDVQTTALKREGTREEVANVALFLASEQSSYVTGDRIICAGGRYM